MKPTWTKRYVDRPGYPADPAVVEFVPAPKYSCEFNLNVFQLDTSGKRVEPPSQWYQYLHRTPGNYG